MRVLVCGGRDYRNSRFLFDTLDLLHKQVTISLIIHGGAKGADALAVRWAQRNEIESIGYLEDWIKHPRSAGAMRNTRMLQEGKPDLVLAFKGGTGTAHMAGIAIRASVRVQFPRDKGED